MEGGKKIFLSKSRENFDRVFTNEILELLRMFCMLQVHKYTGLGLGLGVGSNNGKLSS